MPTYDYLCEHCEYTFEHFQSMSDEPLKECPKCGKPLKRLIGGGLGVIFKGNGFYVNDSKGKNSTTIDSSSKAKNIETAKPKKETKTASDKK